MLSHRQYEHSTGWKTWWRRGRKEKKKKEVNLKKASTIRFHWKSKKKRAPRFLITKTISYADQVMDSESREGYFGTINDKSKLVIMYRYHLINSVFLLQLSPFLDILRPGKLHASSTT